MRKNRFASSTLCGSTSQQINSKEEIVKLKTRYRQHRGVFGVMIVALILALATVLGSGSAASGYVLDFPALTACDFALRVEVTPTDHRVDRKFFDKSGNVVRILSAGKGADLVFTNVDTGATFSLKANGSVAQQTKINPDGSHTETDTGHNVLILFPTDVPAGPSTTLYVGRIVFTVDASFNFTLLQTSGRAVDICEILSE